MIKENKKIRVCVIGVGQMGEKHVTKYSGNAGVELVGVSDVNIKRAREIGDKYRVKVFENHMDLLKLVDAASLAVTTEKHFDVAKDILNSGVHLLIEKPITYDLESADILLNLAHEKNLIMHVGLVERFNPAIVRISDYLNNPLFIETHRMNKFTERGTDVDVVLDLMIHDLDIVLNLVPSEVKEIHAIGMCVITDKTDIANVRLIFENGTVANLTASRIAEKTLRKIRVFQPDAYIHANCYKKEFSITRLNEGAHDRVNLANLKTENVMFENSDPLADQINHFLVSVRKGKRSDTANRDERKALNIALQIIEQIHKGCRTFMPAK
ncbi:MAG: Gfo/Idh/MocA family oxidoreductase [Desulfatiglans sp.]|jgi:predicted dehydrogenase|nr:Gfo/Idh/MocA family oxidoreductase [Desulfatiglans sp.]